MTSNNVTIAQGTRHKAQGTRHKAQGTRPLLSVIIPVYNVEKYLNKCVQSVVNQTYTNLEIILVDDGSTDKSGTICDEWAKKDSRVRVIHKENGGLSSARNAGLDIMTGSLVCFVDSDDYISPDMYEKLYDSMIENDADLSVCNWESFDESGKKIGTSNLPARCITGRQALADIYDTVYSISCAKLYKGGIFQSLRYLNGYIHEDEIIIHHVLGQCNKIVVINDKLYFVVKNSKSITGKIKIGNIQAFINSFKGRLYAFRDRCEYLKNLGISDNNNTLKMLYGTIILAVKRVNYLQYRREISPFLLETMKKLIKSGKFTYWLRAVKLALVCLRSIFRPFINEEQEK